MAPGYFSRVTLLIAIAALWPTQVLAQDSTKVTLVEGQTCLDAGCHADMNEKRVLHKPASKATTCRMCHKATEPGQHDFALAANKTELCSRCHKMVKDEKSQHMPAKRGMCLNCHEPHQSDNRNLLRKSPAGELCMGCHRNIGKEGETVHGPVGKKQCTMCHNPHASEEKNLLNDKQPDLCFKCHRRPLKDNDGVVLTATGQEFEAEDKNKHKPFQSGRCSMCHVPHASDNYRLLKKAYPATFYASFEKEAYICLSCHKSSAFEEPRTLTATGFRNGNLNLHYRHVNKEKGRTCRACHDHHASSNDRLIRSSVPFGTRMIEISEFSLTETGGTCAPACHLPVSYDRWNPVEIGLMMSPREGREATQAELDEARAAQESR